MPTRQGFQDCVDAEPALTGETRDELMDAWDANYEYHLRQGMPEGAAASQATEDAAKGVMRKLGVENMQEQIGALRKAELLKQVDASIYRAVNTTGKRKAILRNKAGYFSLYSLFLPDHHAIARDINLNARINAMTNEVNSVLRKLLEAGRRKWVGLQQDEALMERVVIAAIDGKGDPEATEYAEVLKGVMNHLVERFNNAGGSIQPRSDYGFYHSHDPGLISKAGYEKWRDDIRPLLRDDAFRKSNSAPMKEEEIEDVLTKMYNGILDEVPRVKAVGRAKMNSYKPLHEYHQNRRMLHFKDGQAFVEYHKKYGSGNLYQSMQAHLHERVIEVSTLEHFGPDPDATVEALINHGIDNHGVTDWQSKQLQAAWRVVSGAANVPVLSGVARTSRAIRSITVMAKMGSAILPAFGDAVTSAMVAKWNHIPMWKPLWRALGDLSTKSLGESGKQHRMKMAKLMHAMDYAIGEMPSTSRLGDVFDTGFAGRGAEIAIRAQGLQRWTVAWRDTMYLELNHAFASRADHTFADLPPRMQQTLLGRGVDKDRWDAVRKAMFRDDGIYELIDPSQIADRETRYAWMSVLREEVDRAIPSATDETARLISTKGHQPGTMAGEIFRSAGMFQSYPASVFLGQIVHMLYNAPSERYLLAHYGAMAMAMTGTGALAVQLSEMAKGYDPADMNSRSFWLAAAHKGGFASWAGDFFFTNSEYSKVGDAAGLLGPSARFMWDVVMELGASPFRAGLQGEPQVYEETLGEFAEDWMPYNSLWWLRAAIQSTMMQTIRETTGRRPKNELGRFKNRRWFGNNLDIRRAPSFDNVKLPFEGR